MWLWSGVLGSRGRRGGLACRGCSKCPVDHVAVEFRFWGTNVLTSTPNKSVPSDPGAPDAEAGRGEMRLSFGKLFEKVPPPPPPSPLLPPPSHSPLPLFPLSSPSHPPSPFLSPPPPPNSPQGLTLGTGQCNVKHYNRYLRDLIISGRADPSWVVSHVVGIEEAPTAYRKFDQRVEGYTKVLIRF